MLRRRVDPGVLEGAELARWYRRSPSEIEAEREAARADRYQTFFSPTTDDGPSRSPQVASAEGPTKSVDGGWTEARVTVRPPAPVVRPGGVRTAGEEDVGHAVVGANRGTIVTRPPATVLDARKITLVVRP